MIEAPGWVAIDSALRPLYGDTEPFRWPTDQPWSVGGTDPLDSVSAYPRTDPVPHWHYISYGMSQLYEKELYEKEWDTANDPASSVTSSWGFEFTFRLARLGTDTEPPVWPAHFLQDVARYLFQSGKWLEPGNTIKSNGPIAGDRVDSAIHAVCFAPDPELGTGDSPHGSLRFLQAVGVTMPEYRTARGGRGLELLAKLAPHLPLFVTDIERGPLLPEPKPEPSWPSWGGGLRGRG